ncbi:MAG: hypothetical protein M3P18_06205, partial [Actinomycetota bacterium]|nr:hypothetical protein [Actinomycetota bacterium]
MPSLKELLEPLGDQEMPDRWEDIGRRSPQPPLEPRRGRAGAYVLSFAIVALIVVVVATLTPLGGKDHTSGRPNLPVDPVTIVVDGTASTWTYRGISTSVGPLGHELQSPDELLRHALLVNIAAGAPLRVRGAFPLAVQVASYAGHLGPFHSLMLQDGGARLPTTQGTYVVRVQERTGSANIEFVAAMRLLRTTAVADVSMDRVGQGCPTGTLSLQAGNMSPLSPTGTNIVGRRGSCGRTMNMVQISPRSFAPSDFVSVPMGGVLAIEGHGARLDAVLRATDQRASYRLKLQNGRAVLGPPGTFMLVVQASWDSNGGTIYFPISIEDNTAWQPPVSIPSNAVVTCAGHSTQVDVGTAVAQPDGAHVEVRNTSGQTLAFAASDTDEFDDVAPGTTTLVESFFFDPGQHFVACGPAGRPPDGFNQQISVVDP